MTRKMLAALAAIAVSSVAHAGVLTYSGYLQKASGEPVTTATAITFRFYDAAVGGIAVWEDVVTVVPNADGWFSAVIGGSGGNPLDAADFGQPLWLALQVASDAQEMSPRTQLGAAPYALTVDWSGVAGKPATFPVDPAAVQTRVTGTCAAGQFVTAVNEDGTVMCDAAVDLAAVQARVTGSCGPGTYVAGVNQDGSVVCGTDQVGTGDVTGVVAGTGLTGGGTSGDVTLAVNTNVIQARVATVCPVGQSIRAIDAGGGVACQVDTNTTYTAGAGLALSATTFSIPSNAVTSGMIVDGTVTEQDLLTPHMGIVASTTNVLVRDHYLDTLNGVTSARVRIAVNGRGAGGAGTATVSHGGTVVATFALSAGGGSPWTYFTPSFAVAAGNYIYVNVRAAAAGSPVIIRDLDIDFQ